MLVGFSGSVLVSATSPQVTVTEDLAGFPNGLATGTMQFSANPADLQVTTLIILTSGDASWSSDEFQVEEPRLESFRIDAPYSATETVPFEITFTAFHQAGGIFEGSGFFITHRRLHPQPKF